MSSAGTAPDAECPLSTDLMEWADELFVMEARQRKFVQQRFGTVLAGKRIVCLDIPDEYDYMQAELVELLRVRMAPYLATSE